jgi:hypothetical protein
MAAQIRRFLEVVPALGIAQCLASVLRCRFVGVDNEAVEAFVFLIYASLCLFDLLFEALAFF